MFKLAAYNFFSFEIDFRRFIYFLVLTFLPTLVVSVGLICLYFDTHRFPLFGLYYLIEMVVFAPLIETGIIAISFWAFVKIKINNIYLIGFLISVFMAYFHSSFHFAFTLCAFYSFFVMSYFYGLRMIRSRFLFIYAAHSFYNLMVVSLEYLLFLLK